ncbi:MAG: hypothetical protein R3324_12615 [Halobacteriales archaeon]|nr:hypothetical protein [Halobacteriales archaeon]
MDEKRRNFLKWIGIAPAGSILFLQACGSAEGGLKGDVGPSADGGTGRPDGSSTNTDAGIYDGSTTDGGLSDSGSSDAGGTDSGGDVGEPADAAQTCEPTGEDVEGPFHLEGAPNRTVLADSDEPGDRIVVQGTVYGPDCMTPVAGANLDVWHADTNGNYDNSTTEYRLRGQMTTDENGRYEFETIMPGRYPLGNSTRPAHIHFIVSRPGYIPLTTQMYFEGDPFLKPNDPCGAGCNSGDPTLIVPFSETNGVMQGTFDIVLTRP